MAPNSKANQRIHRRSFLSSSQIGVGAFALPHWMPQLATANNVSPRRAEQAIVILLQGGCSHLDTWDLKPDAPAEIRGEFQSISTKVSGERICEHLPRLAQRADLYNVLRSVHHATPSHEAAIHWVLTGYNYPGANTSTKNRNDKPAMGSIVAKALGPTIKGLPPYVCVPDKGQLGDRVRYASSHFLGMAYDPFESGMPPTNATDVFHMPPNLGLSKYAENRLDHRLELLDELDQLPRAIDVAGAMKGMDLFHLESMKMLSNSATRQAFDLSQEPVALREQYGNTRVGQETILARRLAEAGVPFTLVNFSINQEWDTHENNFRSLKTRLLPEFDQAISALLDDLQQRDRLDSTLVAVITEFGRTPKINAKAGRDHWSDVFSVVMAGGGLSAGQFLGTSNPRGEIPHDRPIHINDVLATIYRQLGVPIHTVYHDAGGRPVPVLFQGKPIPELI